jgi:hypothetical protein
MKCKQFFLFLLVGVFVYSQGPPPPPPPPGLPIDGGLMVLLALALGYGIKKVKK